MNILHIIPIILTLTALFRLPVIRSMFVDNENSYVILHSPPNTAFAPLNSLQLKTAILTCLKLSPKGRCNNHQHGPMGTWDVSRVTDMSRMFSNFKDFDADISDWDVSRVKDMRGMFLSASSFNGDISKWDVSRVEDMEGMFAGARSFNRKLCGLPWVHSKAVQHAMFAGSSGSISRDFCSGSCARTFVPCHRRRRNSVATAFAPKSGEQLQRAVSTVLENSPSGPHSLTDSLHNFIPNYAHAQHHFHAHARRRPQAASTAPPSAPRRAISTPPCLFRKKSSSTLELRYLRRFLLASVCWVKILRRYR